MSKPEVEALLGAPTGYTISKVSIGENRFELELIYIYSYTVFMLESIESSQAIIEFKATEIGKPMEVIDVKIKSGSGVKL